MEINYHNIESYDISTKCRIDGNKIIPFLLKMSELYNLDLCIMSKDLNIIINFKNNFQEKPTIYVSDMINFGACTERFVLISIILMKIYNNFNHSNILLFDLKNKTAEHFEPHGVFKVKSIDINNSIIINKIVNKLWPDFIFIPCTEYSPMIGVQKNKDLIRNCKNTETTDERDGLCGVWSIIYSHLRLLNGDIPHKHIISYMLQNIDIIYLKKYITFIDEIILDDSEEYKSTFNIKNIKI